jgi:Domain of unknown function (DUF4132)
MASLEDVLRGRGDSEAAVLVAAALKRLKESSWMAELELRELPEVQGILDSPDELRRECILDVAGRRDSYDCVRLLSVIARKRVELTDADIEALLSPAGAKMEQREAWWRSQTIRALNRQIEHTYSGLNDDGKARLKPLLERVASEVDHPPTATRIRKLIGTGDHIPYELIDDGDDVGPRLRALIETSQESSEARAAVLDLLTTFPASGRPPKKWHAEAERVGGLLARPAALTGGLLDAALDAADTEEEHTHDRQRYTVTRYVTAGNESLLCGAATFAGVVADPVLLPQLRRLAVKSVTVIGGQFGSPRSLRLANASAQAIANVGAPSSITDLLALERSIRHGTLLKQIRKAIDTLAAAQGMTRDELLERAVEDHGLDPDGTRRVPLSSGSALIEIDGRSAWLVYLDQEDTRRKSVPADVKETDAETLTALREDLKAIRKTIAGERNRLDGLMSLDRRWPIADWRSLYLDHPVTGRLARALVWGFRGGDGSDVVGIPRDATTAVTSSGDEVEIPQDAEARLWHPIHVAAEEVRAWRLYLLEQLIVQPFKQAFRELYVLTPAEEQTRVYSNRFAAHVFRQVQARALMKGRGWKPVPVAWWDDGIDHGVARRSYEPSGIRAEFFFDPILDIEPDTSDLYPYCTSDQVRFFDARSDDPMELADVPLLVFTEAMRDVDLFVGVTSIGADPEWLDRGEGRRFESYWNAYSFGELTAAAEIRREVLDKLLPRLAIADRCKLEERYLAVRGDLRTYRIHLGSGNILMSPNDQYLCIVAARDSRAEKLFLPFDDDPVLSLILSKAFLLANDSAITDKTITAQIKRR